MASTTAPQRAHRLAELTFPCGIGPVVVKIALLCQSPDQSKPMRKRTAGKRRARFSQGVAPAKATVSGPARLPGVHIGHIGGRIGAVAEIRVYWQTRGAVFLHHS